ncbi:hypothetical protein ACQP2E_17055 [Actinoplanes sp. CA-015351]|uniref:hypothetical protein n=1 Tax=Actinoplanes sp. CA-015351 TaxID=3239897 RepID=UPI003D960FBB
MAQQLSLFPTRHLRDRTLRRDYSAAAADFRREHDRHWSWGLAQRHAWRLQRSQLPWQVKVLVREIRNASSEILDPRGRAWISRRQPAFRLRSGASSEPDARASDACASGHPGSGAVEVGPRSGIGIGIGIGIGDGIGIGIGDGLDPVRSGCPCRSGPDLPFASTRAGNSTHPRHCPPRRLAGT